MGNLIVSVMQPYFFPYIGYWQLINESDIFILFDDVQYIKKGFIDRNTIIFNSQPLKIKLELKKSSQNKKINQIFIGNNRCSILNQIDSSYKKAPNYKNFMPIVENIMLNEEENLARFLGYSILKIAEYLNIDTVFKYSSDFKTFTSGKEKIKDLTILNKGNIYLNMIGGKRLYDREEFLKSGINLMFMNCNTIIYPQSSNLFLPFVSILDVCFNTPIEIIKDCNFLKGDIC
jgi:hypothetical protein